MSPKPIRVALVGTFDLNNFGDGLFPRIAGRELHARIPDATITPFSPFGWERQDSFDEGSPAESLGALSEAGADRLSAMDAIVVGGGEIIHFRDELLAPHYGVDAAEMHRRAPSRYFIDGSGRSRAHRAPTLWNAVGVPFDFTEAEAIQVRTALAASPYLAVRDHTSRERLINAGVHTPIAVVPDTAFVLDRLWSRSVLDQRLRFVRLLGCYPVDGAPVVVQGNRSLVPHVGPIAAALHETFPDIDVVILETSHGNGDSEFADALAPLLTRAPFRWNSELGLADVVAAVDAAAMFIGVSLHANITAFVYGRPGIVLDLDSESKLAGIVHVFDESWIHVTATDQLVTALGAASGQPRSRERLAKLQRGVDSHFDRLAAAIITAHAETPGSDHPGPSDVGSKSPGPGAITVARRVLELQHEVGRLRDALAARHQRAQVERTILVDRIDEAAQRVAEAQTETRVERAHRLETESELAGLTKYLGDVTADRDYAVQQQRRVEEQLGGLYATKTMRLMKIPRKLYSRFVR